MEHGKINGMKHIFTFALAFAVFLIVVPKSIFAACTPLQPGQICGAPANCGLFNGTTQCCLLASECPPGSPGYEPPNDQNISASAALQGNCGVNYISSAIGCIPYGRINDTATFFLRWAIGIGGGITLLFIIYSGYIIITSTGDPKRLQHGQELLTSAIGGILVIIFSIFLLRFIGVNILGIL